MGIGAPSGAGGGSPRCADRYLDGRLSYFSFATGGASMTQGHTDIVFTLLSLFLMTVTFMFTPARVGARWRDPVPALRPEMTD